MFWASLEKRIISHFQCGRIWLINNIHQCPSISTVTFNSNQVSQICHVRVSSYSLKLLTHVKSPEFLWGPSYVNVSTINEHRGSQHNSTVSLFVGWCHILGKREKKKKMQSLHLRFAIAFKALKCLNICVLVWENLLGVAAHVFSKSLKKLFLKNLSFLPITHYTIHRNFMEP